MEPRISYEIMLQGMNNGWFTGKKMSDYMTTGYCDYVNSRRIINGLDKARRIAKIAASFEECLRAAGYKGKRSFIEETRLA